MKPFDEKATCPKCGCAEIRTHYCAGYDWMKWGSCTLDRNGQHLHRTCQRCHFEWPEKCLPAAAVPDKPAQE